MDEVLSNPAPNKFAARKLWIELTAKKKSR
jgi:hypothetical protein